MRRIQSIRTAGNPRSLNLNGMLALLLPRSGLVQNCLWGAPRIHGELLKLGFAISERTVSRYLSGRPRTRSQTWRTFFANHHGGQTSIPQPMKFANAHGKTSLPTRPRCRLAPLCQLMRRALAFRVTINRRRSLHSSPLDVRLGHDQVRTTPERARAPGVTGRHLPSQSASRRPCRCPSYRRKRLRD